jgi:molybdopterin synthase catalytic subunit
MIVVQVVGTSGTGKTTFIRDILMRPFSRGKVAVIKHLGHHIFSLDQGKDTTEFFNAGVAVTVGLDEEKAVLLSRDNGLETVLHALCDAGVAITILEGFKSTIYPRIVFGDLSSDQVVLRNPPVEKVEQNLGKFRTVITSQGQVHELLGAPGGESDAIVTIRQLLEGEKNVDPVMLEKRLAMSPSVKGVRAGTDEHAGRRYLFIAIRAADRASALRALEGIDGEAYT